MQELLEILDIPYTGSGVLACVRATDKVLAKHLMIEAGIPTPSSSPSARPPSRARRRGCPAGDRGAVRFPIVVKPSSQGSALGIKFARSAADMPAALVAAFSYDSRVLLERYVDGRDLAVSILDGDPLPVVEAVPHGGRVLRLRGALRDRLHRVRLPGDAAGQPHEGRRSWRPDLRAAGLLGVRAGRPDARRRRRAHRAGGQPDPRSHRDEPAAAGCRGRGDLLRRARWDGSSTSRSSAPGLGRSSSSSSPSSPGRSPRA